MADAILFICVLIVSVVIHENAHGWVAFALGDQTARSEGRLTLNPIRHLDPVGSVVLPALMAVTGNPPFGWAKPVPVNRWNLRGKDRGFAIVALAGPVSNVVLAIVAATALRTVFQAQYVQSIRARFLGTPEPLVVRIALAFYLINILLAAFNLIPIPPLDGSRLLRLVLRPRGIQILDRLEPYGFVVLLLIFVLTPGVLSNLIRLIESLLRRIVPPL